MALIIIPTKKQNNGVPEAEIATLDDVRAAQYHTAHEFHGGVPALSRLMGMSASTLDKKVSLTNSTHHLTNVEAAVMLDVTGDYRLLHVLSARCQHVSINMTIEGDGVTMEKVGILAKEFSDVLEEVSGSVKNGKVTPNEMRRIEKESAEMIAALQGLIVNVRAQMPRARRAA